MTPFPPGQSRPPIPTESRVADVLDAALDALDGGGEQRDEDEDEEDEPEVYSPEGFAAWRARRDAAQRARDRRSPAMFESASRRRPFEAARFGAALAAFGRYTELLPRLHAIAHELPRYDLHRYRDGDVIEASLAEALVTATLPTERWAELATHAKARIRRATMTATSDTALLERGCHDLDARVRAEARKRLSQLGRDVPPWLGLLPFADAVPPEVFSALTPRYFIDNALAAFEVAIAALTDALAIAVLPRLTSCESWDDDVRMAVFARLVQVEDDAVESAVAACVAVFARLADERLQEYAIVSKPDVLARLASDRMRRALAEALSPWLAAPWENRRNLATGLIKALVPPAPVPEVEVSFSARRAQALTEFTHSDLETRGRAALALVGVAYDENLDGPRGARAFELITSHPLPRSAKRQLLDLALVPLRAALGRGELEAVLAWTTITRLGELQHQIVDRQELGPMRPSPFIIISPNIPPELLVPVTDDELACAREATYALCAPATPNERFSSDISPEALEEAAYQLTWGMPYRALHPDHRAWLRALAELGDQRRGIAARAAQVLAALVPLDDEEPERLLRLVGDRIAAEGDPFLDLAVIRKALKARAARRGGGL